MPVSQNEGPTWKNQPGPLLPQKGRGVLATVGKSKISCNKNPLWKTVAPTFNSKAILVPRLGSDPICHGRITSRGRRDTRATCS
jgi:hypothetical protein